MKASVPVVVISKHDRPSGPIPPGRYVTVGEPLLVAYIAKVLPPEK